MKKLLMIILVITTLFGCVKEKKEESSLNCRCILIYKNGKLPEIEDFHTKTESECTSYNYISPDNKATNTCQILN